MRSPGSQRSVVVLALLMLVLLASLGVLQYRWLGAVARAQAESLRRTMGVAAERIARDLDMELSRAFFAFMIPDRGRAVRGEQLSRALEVYRSTAFEPELVGPIHVAEAGQPFVRLDSARRSLIEAIPPPGLPAILERELTAAIGRPRGGDPLSRLPALDDPPTLIVPARPPRGRRGGPPPPERDSEPIVLVGLDREILEERLLPELVETHLGEASADLVVAVFSSDREAGPVFASAPLGERADASWDDADWEVTRPVWIIHPFRELRAELARRQPGGPLDEVEAEEDPPDDLAYSWRAGRGGVGRWTLALAPIDGSLEDAVGRARALNVALSFGTLLLLGITSFLLLRSVRQAGALARRQLDFVAGVTHELNTPLAAISSAADNLADGVVSEPEQVRRYGEMIRGQGRRLAVMVAQTLDFAGIGRAPRPVSREFDLEATTRTTLGDRQWAIDQAGLDLGVQVEPGLPRAMGDVASFSRALGNLVDNAVKYGAAGGRLDVSIGRAGGGHLRVRVRDQGPGIARADADRIFQPFERGASVQVSHVHGSGLGLAVARELIESIGGELLLEPADGPGASFAILLDLALDEGSQDS